MFPLVPLIGATIGLVAAVISCENSSNDYSESKQTYYKVRNKADRNLRAMRRRNRKARRLSNY